jgi:ABC-type maltose transport system permease subunit
MKRQKKGWNNLYYVFLLSLVNGVIGFLGIGSFVGNLFSLALSFVIGGWILSKPAKNTYNIGLQNFIKIDSKSLESIFVLVN